MAETWLDAVALATAVDVSRRMATKIMARASQDKPWKKNTLIVRQGHGRGGASGLCYEVALSSLPAAYQRAFNHALEQPLPLFQPRPPAVRLVPAKGQGAKIERRILILREAMEHAPRSDGRAAAVQRASELHGIPLRTLQRWMQALDDSGGDANALAHKRPSNAGQKRVAVTYRFDKAFKAAGYDAALLPELRERLVGMIQGHWTGREGLSGCPRVLLEARDSFHRLCRERGFDLPVEACELPRNMGEPYREFRDVALREYDRKTYDDRQPKIRRDNTRAASGQPLLPLQIVCMDVKPIDCVMTRPDGSEAWPKLIGFMDIATRRLFAHIVLLNKGEGVRAEHVLDGFTKMVSHPEWGFPQQLYRDNGTEYYCFDRIREALAMVNDTGVRTIVNAKPYAGSSKPIESLFAMIDNFIFSQMEGYAGGDRMNKKIQTLGKGTPPYVGSIEQFDAEVQLRIRDYEGQPLKSGPMKGVSPYGRYAEHRMNGWAAIRIDPASLDAAFCKRDVKRVDRGAVTIGGIRYRHPELPSGRTIDIAIPYRRGSHPAFFLPSLNDWIGLEPEQLYAFDDRSGAAATGRMKQANNRRVATLKRTATPVNAAANLHDRVARLPALPAPRDGLTVITGDEQPHFASANENALTEKQRRKAAEREETLWLEQLYGGRSSAT